MPSGHRGGGIQDGRALHQPAIAASIVTGAGMGDRSVVPEYKVASIPLVPVDEPVLGHMCRQILQQLPALSFRQAEYPIDDLISEEKRRLLCNGVNLDERMDDLGDRCPLLLTQRFGCRVDFHTKVNQRGRSMHRVSVFDTATQTVGQCVVSGMHVGKPCFAALIRHHPSIEHRRQRLDRIADLRITFHGDGGRSVHAVDRVDLSVAKGATLGLVGESGCGKSVTSLAIMGLLPKDTADVTGSIKFDGFDLLEVPDKTLRDLRGNRLAMISRSR